MMFLTLFVIFYILTILTHVGLILLNLNNMKKKGGKVPDEFASYISAEELARANSYASDKSRLEIISYIFNKSIVLIFLLSGLFAYYAGLFIPSKIVGNGLIFFAGLYLLTFVLNIPFGYYSSFVLEEKYGFNTSTKAMWMKDQLKELLLGALLGGFLLLGLLLLIKYLPNLWWLFGWLLAFLFSLFIAFIYPAVIVPIFNKLMPLTGRLADMIGESASRAGIAVKKISEMDASKRSKKTNAYFAGFGRSKQIVLYDTLIKTHPENEILGILAHEIGHWKYRHVVLMIALSQIFAFVGFFVAGFLLKTPIIYEMFGVENFQFYAGLFIISLIIEIPVFFFSPLTSGLSRYFERQADRFAVTHTNDEKSFVSALKRLAKENLSNLFPHPLYVAFFHSHPPVLERIDYLKKL